MRDLSQFSDGRLLVDKLLVTQVSKTRAIETHSEIGPKHSLTTEGGKAKLDYFKSTVTQDKIHQLQEKNKFSKLTHNVP